MDWQYSSMEFSFEKDFVIAVKKNETAAIQEILLENRELIKSQELGQSMFNLALARKNYDAMKLIIDAGLDLNFDSCLTDTIESLSGQPLEFLLKSGAILKPKHMILLLSSFLIRRQAPIKVLSLIIEYAPMFTNLQDEKKRRIFNAFISCINSSIVMSAEVVVKMLIKSGVPFDGADYTGSTLLNCSLRLQYFEVAKLLINEGADLELQDRLGCRPLHLAVINCYLRSDVVELLLSKGAEIDAKNYNESTALHQACDSGNENVVSLLVERGADLTATNCDGKTAFYSLAAHSYNRASDQACIQIMIKEFSKLTYENISFAKSDLQLIEQNPEYSNLFEKCTSEVRQMASTKFYASYSYYDVLKMARNRMKKLAKLTKNDGFLQGFEKELNQFSYYTNNLRRVLQEAIQVRDQMIIVEERLKIIFGDFLPSLVLTNLAQNFKVEDLPLE